MFFPARGKYYRPKQRINPSEGNAKINDGPDPAVAVLRLSSGQVPVPPLPARGGSTTHASGLGRHPVGRDRHRRGNSDGLVLVRSGERRVHSGRRETRAKPQPLQRDNRGGLGGYQLYRHWERLLHRSSGNEHLWPLPSHSLY